jgi:hypothetical protein
LKGDDGDDGLCGSKSNTFMIKRKQMKKKKMARWDEGSSGWGR